MLLGHLEFRYFHCKSHINYHQVQMEEYVVSYHHYNILITVFRTIIATVNMINLLGFVDKNSYRHMRIVIASLHAKNYFCERLR